jgi:cytochrome c peroxidase
VIQLYEKGGRIRRPSLSENIKPFTLTEGERGDLIAFLRTLDSGSLGVGVPLLPR